jgi:predicted esterase
MLRRLVAATLAMGAGAAVTFAQLPASVFEVNRIKPFNVSVGSSERRGAATVTQISYDRVTSGRRGATIVMPAGRSTAVRPGILFVHWYEPPNPTSNRTEFVDDAVALADAGAVSLLVDTMWSDPNWFDTRDPESDLSHSIEQVKELRRALDLLQAQPGVNPARLFYVGHDFGAMYGAIVAGLDARRLKGFVFMAGTRAFSDWFLLWPRRTDDAAKAQVVARTASIDPPLYLAMPSALPMLFQFASQDKFVTRAAAESIVAVVKSPKEVRWYDAAHALNADAARDRVAWLKARLQAP